MQLSSITHRVSWTKAIVAGLGIGCGLAALPASAQETPSLGVNAFPAYTAPVEKRAQNFDLPGVVQKVMVKEGDHVKAGQLIAQQNIDGDEARLKGLELLANSDLEEKAEQVTLAKDEVDFKRKGDLLAKHALSPEEFETARLQRDIDALKLQHAKEDRQKAQYDVAEQKAKIEQKKLYAKIDGIVSEINTHEGELANSDTQHPTMTIVKNDVVYVEVDLPAEIVTKLKTVAPNKPLQVQYVDETGKNSWHEATIHFIKPEADPKSNTEHVQLSMANPEGRSAGLQVLVKLPAEVAPPVAATAANQ